MESTYVQMPTLQVSIYIDRTTTKMPDGAFSTTILLPSKKQNMIISRVEGNTFQIPPTELILEVGAGVYTKLSPCLSIRITAPGNKILNPANTTGSNSPNLQQHMFTVFVELQKLLYSIHNGSVYHVNFQTNEDARSYDLYIKTVNFSPEIKKQVYESLQKLSLHIQNLQCIHGMSLMTVSEAVNICNKERQQRWSDIKNASLKLFGSEKNVAEWFLCMNRMFSGLKIDIAQSNYMRKHAVMLNPEFNMTMLMFICGGIISEIVNNTNTLISCEKSVRNQVDVWCTQPEDVIKNIFIVHLVRHNATTTAYLSDAGWDNNGQTLVCSNESKEDQLPFAGWPFESILNYMLSGIAIKVGDCEDLTAMIQGILDLFDIPREEFYRLVITSLQMIPVYYNNSKAASDYTVHQDSYKTISLRLRQIFEPRTIENNTQLRNVQDIFDQCRNLSDSGIFSYERSAASILAKASRIDANFSPLAQNTSPATTLLSDYTRAWQQNLANPGKDNLYQGHACAMISKEIFLGTAMNVDVHLVKDVKILESTSNARQDPKYPPVKADFGDTTIQREMITLKLGGGTILPRTLTANIESTLRSLELAAKLPKETGVFASQVFTLGSNTNSEFYELKLQTNGCAMSLQDLGSGKYFSAPGTSLNTELPNCKNLRLSAKIGPQEKEALELLGSVGAMSMLTLERMSVQKMLSPLNPLSSRQRLRVGNNGEMSLAPPERLLQTQSSTGCVIKCLYGGNEHLQDVESFAKNVAKSAGEVLKTDSHMIMGAFLGGVTLEAPL
ncbi:MAG: hypothetical protein EBR09_12710 [Proteobacteria bacterium]|jgi:hypothetical protein|nr:hypothetical protein [Pseudomonadota bacterium]